MSQSQYILFNGSLEIAFTIQKITMKSRDFSQYLWIAVLIFGKSPSFVKVGFLEECLDFESILFFNQSNKISFIHVISIQNVNAIGCNYNHFHSIETIRVSNIVVKGIEYLQIVLLSSLSRSIALSFYSQNHQIILFEASEQKFLSIILPCFNLS